MSGKVAPAGNGAARRGPGGKGKAAPDKDGVIVSVEEKVWTLRMGAKDPPCNVARFDEMWVGKGDGKRKVPRPPFDDPTVFSKPAYMYRVQEAEEHSEDEDYEGPGKFDAFDRPAFKRRPIKNRAIQWALEDSKDYSKGGGIKYLGDKTTQQMSRYATFKVDSERPQTIEVTPIDEWWHFKKAPRDAGKMMSVKEAEEAMKKQENFLGPLSLANKILGKKTLEAAAKEGGGSLRYKNLDREDTQVLQEAGVKLGSPEDGLDNLENGSGSEEDFGPEKGDVDSDAGGEDDDFGDEVRSDDEEEVGNDDANEGGGTLHQDDEDLNDSDDEHLTDDEHHELQKLSRSVNAEGEEEEDDYTVDGDPGRASPTAPALGAPPPAAPKATGVSSSPASAGGSGKRAASAMEDGGAAGAGAGGDAAGAAGAGGGGGGGSSSGSKRARKAQKKGAQEISQANVVATLKRYGGRLASEPLLRHFVAALKANGKKNPAALATLKEILKKVATKVDDAIDGTVWILKKHYS
eukprot:g9988.t1